MNPKTLQQTKEFLRTELGLEPQAAEIKQGEQNYYDGIGDIIYLKKDADESSLFHEYAHAIFMQQSELGRQQRAKDRELFSLEEQLNLPHNKELTFRQSKDFKVENSTVHTDLNNTKVKEYMSLSKEAKKFFEYTRKYHEGFAEWMETVLLKELCPKATAPQGNEACQGFTSDENRWGPLTVLYDLGFPKSKETRIIRKYTQENLGDLSKYKIVVFYGSGNSDIDIMAVGSKEPRKTFSTNNFDSVTYSEEEFRLRMELLDIEAADAMLTGRCIEGDEEYFNHIRKSISSTKPTEKAITYAKKKSLDAFNTAMFFFYNNQFNGRREMIRCAGINDSASLVLEQDSACIPGKDLISSLNNASYAMSYMLSGLYYAQEKKATTFRELMYSNRLLEGIVACTKGIRKLDDITEEAVFDCLKRTRDELAGLLSSF
ncbi:MAG: hypothetical protein ABIB71_02150 [Candidatus Woesearchaeota archaeon]